MDVTSSPMEQLPIITIGTKKRQPPKWFLWLFSLLMLVGVFGISQAKNGHIAELLAHYQVANVVLKVRDSNKLPIPNAQVVLAGQTYTTDLNGRVQLDHLQSGTYPVSITKEGFITNGLQLVLHRQENPLQIIQLTAEAPVRFAVRGYIQDALSKQSITNVSVKLGDTLVLSDPNGQFSFPNLLPGAVSLQLSADGYVSQNIKETLTTADLVLSSLVMTPTGLIYFDSNRDGKHGIYTANLDGTNQHRLIAAGAGEDFAPLVAPDGNHILFQSTRDAVVDSAGHPLRRLYIVSSDGTGLRPISQSVATAFMPIWSANSSWLYAQGYLDASLAQASRQLYNPKDGTFISMLDAASNVTFSPDSMTVAYTIFTQVAGSSSVNSQLKALALKGGTPAVLATRPQEISDLHFEVDSQTVGYQIMQSSTIQGYQIGITSHIETSVPIRPASKRLYALSFDGKWQAYIDERDGRSDLFVATPDAHERQLTQLGTADSLYVPHYDPTGRYLTFASVSSSGPVLYEVAVAGGDPIRLTEYSPN